MAGTADTLYSALAKWERHRRGHSPGYLNLSRERLWFVPHERSILDKGFDIALDSISSVERSDNWLWRGAADVHLSMELSIEFSFPTGWEILVETIEEPLFHSDKLRLFLGSKRKGFLQHVRELAVVVME